MQNAKYIPKQTVTGNIATKKLKIHKTIINSTLLRINNQFAWNWKAVLEQIIPCQCLHAHISFHILINITYVTYAGPLLRTDIFIRIHRPNFSLLHNKPSATCTDRAWYVICFLLRNSPASEFYMGTFRNTLSVHAT